MPLTGQTFNCFTVIQKTDKHAKNRHRIYKCQCECGKIVEYPDDDLKLKKVPKTCIHTTRGIRLDAITPERIKEVLNLVEPGSDIFNVLRKLRLSQNSFFLALKKNAELSNFYDECRKIRIEELLESIIDEVDQAETKIELGKAKIKLIHYQWKAEKLIPEVYGAKVQIDVNKTVDIRGALDEARARAGIIEATYKTVEDEVKKELPEPNHSKPEPNPSKPEPLPADSNEIDFAEMYQRSINPSAEDLLG